MSKEVCSSDEGTPDPPDESTASDTPHSPPQPIDEWMSREAGRAASRTLLSAHAPSWSPAAGPGGTVAHAAPIVCRYFAAGTCRFGDACRHHHPANLGLAHDAPHPVPSEDYGHLGPKLIPSLHMTLPPAAATDSTQYAGYRLKRTGPSSTSSGSGGGSGTRSQKVSPQLQPATSPNPYQGHRIHLPEGYPEPLLGLATEPKDAGAGAKAMKGHNPYAW